MAAPLGLSDALLDGFVGKFYRETDGVRHLLSRVSSPRSTAPSQQDEPLFTLPQIVVVGQESSGKSSVLESLAMLPLFPRDERICTRMPIHLKLRRSSPRPHSDADGEVDAPPEITMRLVYADSRPPVESTMTFTPDQVAPLMRKWMDDIIAMESSGGGGGVVAHVVEIHVSSPFVPTLDLIDLPGIVAGRLPGEPDDMMEQTRALVESYLAKPDTLVLAVVPAGERVRNSQAFQLVQKYGLTSRTVGVLTMCDRAADTSHPDGPFADVLAKLTGGSSDVVPLEPHGYVVVKNRDTRIAEREQLPLGTFKTHETAWFCEHLGKEWVDKGLASSGALAVRIERMLVAHVHNVWVPRTVMQLMAEKKAREKEVGDLGMVTSKICEALKAETHETLQGLLGESVRRMVAMVDAEVVQLAWAVHGKLMAHRKTHRSLLRPETTPKTPSVIESILEQQEAVSAVRANIQSIVNSVMFRVTHLLRKAIEKSTTGSFHVRRFDQLHLLAAAAMWEKAKELVADPKGLTDRLVESWTRVDGPLASRIQMRSYQRDEGLKTTVGQVVHMLITNDGDLALALDPLEQELVPAVNMAVMAVQFATQTDDQSRKPPTPTLATADTPTIFRGITASEARNLLAHAAKCNGTGCESKQCVAVRRLVSHAAPQACANPLLGACNECRLLHALTRHHVHVCDYWKATNTTEEVACTVCTWHFLLAPEVPAMTTPDSTDVGETDVEAEGETDEFHIGVVGDGDDLGNRGRHRWHASPTSLKSKASDGKRGAVLTKGLRGSTRCSGRYPDFDDTPEPTPPPASWSGEVTGRKILRAVPAVSSANSPTPATFSREELTVRDLAVALSRVVAAPLVGAIVDPVTLGRHALVYLDKHPLGDNNKNRHWFHDTTQAKRLELVASCQCLQTALDGLARVGEK